MLDKPINLYLLQVDVNTILFPLVHILFHLYFQLVPPKYSVRLKLRGSAP